MFGLINLHDRLRRRYMTPAGQQILVAVENVDEWAIEKLKSYSNDPDDSILKHTSGLLIIRTERSPKMGETWRYMLHSTLFGAQELMRNLCAAHEVHNAEQTADIVRMYDAYKKGLAKVFGTQAVLQKKYPQDKWSIAEFTS